MERVGAGTGRRGEERGLWAGRGWGAQQGLAARLGRAFGAALGMRVLHLKSRG